MTEASVLIIDPDRSLCDRIDVALGVAGLRCRVAWTPTGAMAIAKVRSTHYDLVIVQFALPDMPGRDVCAALRPLADHPPPVILLTPADCDAGTRAAAYEAGADDVLAMPASDQDLVAKIRLMLRLKEADDRVRSGRARIRALSSEQAALLRQSEERFRALAQHATEGVVVVASDGTIKYTTLAMQRILGWEPDEAEGRAWWELVHPADLPRLREAWEQLLESTMAATVVDARVRHKNGAWSWLQVVASNQLHVPGVYGVVMNCRDIQDTKRISAALHASQKRYKRLIDTTQDGLWATDEKERTTFVNARMAELLGYPEPEILGMPAEELMFPDDVPAFRTRMDRRSAGETEIYEHRFRRKDGSPLWALVSASPMFDADDQYCGAFAFLTDISDKKAMDEQLRDALARFEAVIEATPLVAVQCYDRDGRITHWNPASEALYGYAREEALGRLGSELLLDGAEREAFAVELERAWIEATPSAPAVWPVHAKDGSVRHVYSTLVPVKRGEVVGGVFCMDVDVTERIRIERELAAAKQQLQQANEELEARVHERTAALAAAIEELDAFAYSVTHDLRAPLRAISGFSSILQSEAAANLTGDAARYLGYICDNVRQMDALICDLLEFSRCSRQDLCTRPLDMALVVREALADQDPALVDRCRVTIDNLPSCHGDPKLMRLVLTNLLSNALKYSRTREAPEVRITGGEEPGGAQVYTVYDNGVGFDERYAHRLFGVFQRLHTADEFEGTGVGLAIVKRIVARHGGEVWATSELGQGSAFSFRLPPPTSA